MGHRYLVLELQPDLKQIRSDLCVLTFEGGRILAQILDEALRKIRWMDLLSNPSRSGGGLAASN